MIVLDTSVVLALMDRGEPRHADVRDWIEGIDEDLVTTPLAVAEMDYLVSDIGGPDAARALRRNLEEGIYIVEWWDSAILDSVATAERYALMELGLTDASLMALAARFGTTRLATLDERHFRAVRPLSGEPAFTLLPADA